MKQKTGSLFMSFFFFYFSRDGTNLHNTQEKAVTIYCLGYKMKNR